MALNYLARPFSFAGFVFILNADALGHFAFSFFALNLRRLNFEPEKKW